MSLDEQLLARSSEESNKNKGNGGNHSRNTSDMNKKLPKPKMKMNINVPSSQFEVDSPLKSPMWQRVLGRK